MPAKKNKYVNLDALISREDFETSHDSKDDSQKITTINVSSLKDDNFFFNLLRKPDFQRETAYWDVDRVTQFIASYVDGSFIPAIILWRSQDGLIFVIDGSHRLSSLIAWVNDDYGDKHLSLAAFDGGIPEEQIVIAKKTRERINNDIGSYQDFVNALKPKYDNPEFQRSARFLATNALPIQWIEGDVVTAEKSFFNINQQAVPIDPIESILLTERKSPVCISARAIVKAGRGHKYWNSFSDEIQKEVEALAESIHTLLFTPKMTSPIKTLDLPICDQSGNKLELVYNLISFCFGKTSTIDPDGSETVKCLRRVQKAIQMFSSTTACSFGLHPIVYCYSNKGNFRTASFYGALEFLNALNSNEKIRGEFIVVRRDFESFVMGHDSIVQNMIDMDRRGTQSAKRIAEYYCSVIQLLAQGKTCDESLAELSKNKKFKISKPVLDSAADSAAAFSSGTKNAVFIRDAFPLAQRCAICGGLLHANSISYDHILPKRDGGQGNLDNCQLTHPFCNTGVKC